MEGGDSLLAGQPFAKPDAVRELVAESYRKLKTELPKITSSMSLYLANKGTEAILFKPIKVSNQKYYSLLERRVCIEHWYEYIWIGNRWPEMICTCHHK